MTIFAAMAFATAPISAEAYASPSENAVTRAAQEAAEASAVARKAAMARLGFLEGDWEGVNVSRTSDGKETRSRSADTIRYRMGGDILTIAGRKFASGAGLDDPPVVENFGVFDFDTETGTYRVTAFVRGLIKKGTGHFREDGKLQWSIAGGARNVRFLAWPEIGEDGAAGWVETGEFSYDGGKSWAPAFEIHFRPVEPAPAEADTADTPE